MIVFNEKNTLNRDIDDFISKIVTDKYDWKITWTKNYLDSNDKVKLIPDKIIGFGCQVDNYYLLCNFDCSKNGFSGRTHFRLYDGHDIIYKTDLYVEAINYLENIVLKDKNCKENSILAKAFSNLSNNSLEKMAEDNINDDVLEI